MKKEEFFGLHRTEHDRLIAGVCGGLAHSWGIDPTLLRLAWVILTLASPLLGVALYCFAWFILPFKTFASGDEEGAAATMTGRHLGHLLGWILVILGAYYLAEQLTHGALGRFLAELRRYLWPIVLIAIGGVLLIPRGSGCSADGGKGASGNETAAPR